MVVLSTGFVVASSVLVVVVVDVLSSDFCVSSVIFASVLTDSFTLRKASRTAAVKSFGEEKHSFVPENDLLSLVSSNL